MTTAATDNPTLVHRAASLLPGPVYRWARPHWNRLRVIADYYQRGGRIHHDGELACWMMTKPMADGRPMAVSTHTFREFRRFAEYGHAGFSNTVYKWLHWLPAKGTLYDVGSNNGLEGLLANHLHGGLTVFIEPHGPSVGAILKSVYRTRRNPGFRGDFEIVHAGCGDEEGYARLLMHAPPVPGNTRNTVASADFYADAIGRPRHEVFASHWLKIISLDSLHYTYGLPAPDYVKIDVDGFEDRVMKGSARLLADKKVRSWQIEITGEGLLKDIPALMARHGYVEAAHWDHYPGYTPPTLDITFVRPEDLDSWNAFTSWGAVAKH